VSCGNYELFDLEYYTDLEIWSFNFFYFMDRPICSLKSPSLGLPSSELLNFRENRVFCMHCDDGRTNRWTGLLRTRTNLDYNSTSNNSKTVADRAIYLQWPRPTESRIMVYRTAPFSMILNNP